MFRRVVLPQFGTPPAEYDPAYLADVTRAYSTLIELLLTRGEGQFSKVFVAGLEEEPTSAIEAREVFSQNGVLMIAEADGSIPSFGIVPSGTTAQRPASPAKGQLYYNDTLTRFEGYDGSSWVALS